MASIKDDEYNVLREATEVLFRSIVPECYDDCGCYNGCCSYPFSHNGLNMTKFASWNVVLARFSIKMLLPEGESKFRPDEIKLQHPKLGTMSGFIDMFKAYMSYSWLSGHGIEVINKLLLKLPRPIMIINKKLYTLNEIPM